MNIYRLLHLRFILPLISFLFILTPSHAYVVGWSEDFDTEVSLNTATAGLTAGDWYVSGSGITSPTGNTSITLDADNDRVILATGTQGNDGAVQLGAYGQGQGTPLAGRRVSPGDYEVSNTFDLISFRGQNGAEGGQADLTVRSRGLDGYVQYKLSPAGRFQFSHWLSNYVHKGFGSHSVPSSLRNNTNNPGIVIETGGTFVPDGTDVEITISGDAEGAVVMNADSTAVVSVSLSNYGSGYTADPTVTFSGGGMTVAPTISFNYETGNSSTLLDGSSSTNHISVDNLGGDSNPLSDGDSLTIVQSYNSATDTIRYFYGLNGNPATNLIATIDPTQSALGYGFFDVITGNRYSGTPQNKDAAYYRYQRWSVSNGGISQIALSNYSLKIGADIDADGDGVIDRDDALPNDPNDSVDSDGDGVGDSSDVHPGYNDAVLTPYLHAWLSANNYIVDDGTTGGLTEADLIDLRPGSTMIAVSDGTATVNLQMQESADLSVDSWSNTGDPVPFTLTLEEGEDAQFFRVKLAED